MIVSRDEEQEDFQAAVDLYKSGQLEESLCLAKETLGRSAENLADMMEHDENVGEGYERLTNGDDGDEDTELEGKSGVIKFRINQDFLIEHSCILHIRSNLLLL